jgi:hypothetical protein
VSQTGIIQFKGCGITVFELADKILEREKSNGNTDQ